MFSWTQFYETGDLEGIRAPSKFAVLAQHHFEPGARIIDIGSGNGRDSTFFQALGHDVTAVDPCASALAKNETHKKRLDDADGVCGAANDFDVVYMRFSLHSVSEETEDRLFSWARGSRLFCIETRSVHDPRFGRGERVAENAFSDNGHYRRFTDLDALVRKALHHGFQVVHASVDFKAAALPTDQAVVNRLILIQT